jgi:hypothetical protein
MRLNAPEWVIDLGRIDSMRGIRDDGDAIVIGATTTHHELARLLCVTWSSPLGQCEYTGTTIRGDTGSSSTSSRQWRR